MKNLNVVTIAGRLTRDAELRNSNGGLAIVTFTLAWNTSKKSGDQWVDKGNFIRCTMFGRLAESIHRYLLKGRQVIVSGELHLDEYTNREGEDKREHKIIVQQLELGSEPRERTVAQAQRQRQRGDSSEDSGGWEDLPSQESRSTDGFEDDIPF